MGQSENQYKIFLSHSSLDASLAAVLAHEIEKELSPDIRVFASTRPDAIPSGANWLDIVLEKLENAEILVILITAPATNSFWVSFELGYFWHKTQRKNIHTLYHRQAHIPNPLDTLQSKLITSSEQVQNFFESLCDEFGRKFKGKAQIQNIIRSAEEISIIPPERSLANFERLLEYSQWDKIIDGGKEIWICSEDALFQIIIDYDMEDGIEFSEDWTQKFPSHTPGHKYPVKLTLAGLPIEIFWFISLDSGRYFVPMPELGNSDNDGLKYVWKRNSIIFKIARVVSYFYLTYPTIDAFANHAEIEIT